ncbi:hypothetical protein [Mucilaginibacter sp.]|uniref:hypothetical protein n=1 Tax=Mucilaginibacter sp. TaxID=1882438 RepID=UPI0035BBA794
MALMSSVALGQTTVISGIIKDQQGNGIPMAFVRDVKHSYGTYSNLNGFYSLQADPTSILLASALNHKDKAVKIDNNSTIDLTMASADTIKTTMVGSKMISDESKQQSGFFTSSLGNVSIRTQQVESVKGSRYLFVSWVHGFAITKSDSIIQSNDYLCNYDKIDGSLLFSRNTRDALLADKNQIKSFTLVDDGGKSYTYAYNAAINSNKFVAVITSGNKYSIYKDLSTRFIKANYVTNGITSSGNNYDEYVDENTYYIAKAGGQPQRISLRKKSIKSALAADAQRVQEYMDAQTGEIDETYLAGLGEQLNK